MRDTDTASPSEVGVRGGRLYLNGATVMTTSTDRQLAVAREAGFSGIEARAERLTGAAGGVRVAFEFLGFPDCPIRTPRLAGEVVRGVDGVELILDVAHWHASGSPPLEGFPVDRLAMVHLNDLPPKPLAELEDADRLLPREGVIRLVDLLRDLRARRYAGPWSLETFNPAHWRADPLDL